MSEVLRSKYVTKRFGVELGERYRRFLTSNEWQTLDGRYALVPTYASALRVRFLGIQLESFFRDEPGDEMHPAATEAELGGEGGWIPLATLGDEESTFLAVRANEHACPVGMWEPETKTWRPCADSLDAFLAALGRTAKAAKAPAPTHRPGADLPGLRDAVKRVESSMAGRRTKAQLAKIEAALAQLEPLMTPDNVASEETLRGSDHQGLPSRALLYKAKALEALGRFEEACAVLDHSIIDGQKANVAPEMSCRLQLHELDRPQRVIELCQPDEDMKPLRRELFALALFRVGELERAVKQLELVVERQVEATLALSPKKDRADETKKRLATVRANVEAYAARHGLAHAAKDLLAMLDRSAA